MPKEIERKFLVKSVPEGLSVHPEIASYPFHCITQGYLAKADDALTVWVGLKNGQGVLALKGHLLFECPVPVRDAQSMFELFADAQGNFAKNGPAVRIRLQDGWGFLTIKGKASANGWSRDEFEYAIPRDAAQRLLDGYCQTLRIRKTRYCIPYGEHTIELDVFHGPLQGLVLAEVELPSEDAPFSPPDWLGDDVSNEKGYSNFSLAEKAAALASSPA